MIRRPPTSTRTDTLFPYTTLFRSLSPILRTICQLSALAKFACRQPKADPTRLRSNGSRRSDTRHEEKKLLTYTPMKKLAGIRLEGDYLTLQRLHETLLKLDRKSTRLNSSH